MRSIAAVLVVTATSLFAQSADELQKSLAREAVIVEAWAANQTVIAAVRAQNAKNVPLAESRRLDEQWQAGKAEKLVTQTTTGPCADELRKLIATDPRYAETLVMDARGVLVCASQPTSDYWQGDEPKWKRPFTDGKAFIDRPRLDESTQSRLAQISLPIVDGKKPIGVITVGVRIR